MVMMIEVKTNFDVVVVDAGDGDVVYVDDDGGDDDGDH